MSVAQPCCLLYLSLSHLGPFFCFSCVYLNPCTSAEAKALRAKEKKKNYYIYVQRFRSLFLFASCMSAFASVSPTIPSSIWMSVCLSAYVRVLCGSFRFAHFWSLTFELLSPAAAVSHNLSNGQQTPHNPNSNPNPSTNPNPNTNPNPKPSTQLNYGFSVVVVAGYRFYNHRRQHSAGVKSFNLGTLLQLVEGSSCLSRLLSLRPCSA